MIDPRHYLEERYCGAARKSAALRAYYQVKPYLPRRIQLALRRAYAPRQAGRDFPAWPIEPILVDHMHAELKRELEASTDDGLPIVNYWPGRNKWAAIVTHDVEGPEGVENIARVREVERKYGVVSSWNFVAEWYSIPEGTFDFLRSEGCEIGLHGIKHDGKLFQDRDHFERDLPKIHSYMETWGAVGFRSPATHRNADWMPELACLYDSSFPDTDPFEPQAGGCCSIFPFFLEDLVELPITLPQDHTLWEILGDRSIRRWIEKSAWIIENHGLINVIVHPDYVVSQGALDLYERFLAELARWEGGWHALPRDIAEWWQERDRLTVECSSEDATPQVVGETSYGATVAWVRPSGGDVAIDI